jgi:hypothetical protein
MKKGRKNMNPERLLNTDLLKRLLASRMFPWPEEQSLTIKEKINSSAAGEVTERLKELKSNLKLSPAIVIDRLLPRVESWQFGTLLDHIGLKRIPRLSYFSS